MNDYNTLIIRNIDKSNNKLRPSDWADRIAGLAAKFEAGRLCYDQQVMPCRSCDDVICLRVQRSIARQQPEVMQTITEFMVLNQLDDFASQCPQHAYAYARHIEQRELSRLVTPANENKLSDESDFDGDGSGGFQSAA